MTVRVALDTSALMLPVQADLRVFEELDRLLGEHEPVVPGAVLAELEALARGNGEEATAASVGRDLADRCTTVDTAAD
jgi:rRNA-processing protein FCF1